MNQVSKIIIIIIKKRKIKGKLERTERVEKERLRGFYLFIYIFFRFFLRSMEIGS